MALKFLFGTRLTQHVHAKLFTSKLVLKSLPRRSFPNVGANCGDSAKRRDLAILALFGGLEMFHEVSELDLGKADKKKFDELDARLNVLEEKVKKL